MIDFMTFAELCEKRYISKQCLCCDGFYEAGGSCTTSRIRPAHQKTPFRYYIWSHTHFGSYPIVYYGYSEVYNETYALCSDCGLKGLRNGEYMGLHPEVCYEGEINCEDCNKQITD